MHLLSADRPFTEQMADVGCIMQRAFLTCCLLTIVALGGCSGDKAQELLQTAEFEERQNNLQHAKQLYDDIIRFYPTSKQAETARARLASLNQSR